MDSNKYNKLTSDEERVIIHKGTERPFSGEYTNFTTNGIYTCKQCNAPLYNSKDKFQTSCGWPSFDAEVKDAVTRKKDKDGFRTEILCSNCRAHLGHVFEGEMLTEKNIRHCVNSISMNFKPIANTHSTAKAYVAGGCFWGVEYMFQKKVGVISVTSGYMGGTKTKPTYQDICYGDTGHVEAVEIEYDPSLISYENILKFFFEIHDPTQEDGQGPDIGEQYLSVIFYKNENEKRTAEELIIILKSKGYNVVTSVDPVCKFWDAEEYHQNYYDRLKKSPYCHIYKKKF